MKLLLASLLVLAVFPAAAIESAKASTENARPKSVFESTGKDPFAPTRKTQRVEKAAPALPFYRLSLNGVTRENGKSYALISGSSLAEGESGFLKGGDASIRIVCKEIRDTSVLVQVGSNKPIELSLGQRIQLDDKGAAPQALGK
ncbi:MAG: hypothetical protein JWM68_1845 [Verrucomicrobiales bacterium]|nr:hypothetical protein [Verrucomicrobiales bacterium]